MRGGRPLMNAGILGPHVGDCLGTDGRGLIGVTGGLTAFAPVATIMARNRVTGARVHATQHDLSECCQRAAVF